MASPQCRALKVIRSKCNPNSIFRHFSSVRERTGFNPSSDFNSEGDDGRNSHNPPQPIPNRPLRAERGESSYQRNKPFKDERGERQPHQFQSQSQSNKNFRGERGKRPSRQSQYQSHPSSTTRGPRNGRFNGSHASTSQIPRDNHTSDDDFLEKFKLRLDKKENKTPLSNDPTPSSTDDSANETDSNSPPPDANEIFKKMKETGLIPNAVAMLDGLCKDGLVQDAMKLFGLMREKGTIPEVVVYTAVVDGFCKAQKLDDAKRIFRKMLDNGITPNAFSYTVLIQGLYKCDSIDDAVDFSFQMLDAGHSPNVTTFVGLVDGLCRNKGIEEARSVIEALQKKGFFVNQKAVREFLDRSAPLSSPVWEAVFGRRPSQPSQRPF